MSGPGRRRRRRRRRSAGSSGSTGAITADVGGTSFDTCLILDGRPQRQVRGLGRRDADPDARGSTCARSAPAAARSRTSTTAACCASGPQSAGAVPGPACYGRGGTQPTVTDAAACSACSASGQLAGGLVLDIDRRRAASLEPLAERLGLDVDAVARRASCAIATASMANAIREVTVEQGEDPRDAALIAFGGAGPLFGTLLAQRARACEPSSCRPTPGNFSAWGLLAQDIARSAAHVDRARRSTTTASRPRPTLETLVRAARRARPSAGVDAADRTGEAALDLRYARPGVHADDRSAAGRDRDRRRAGIREPSRAIRAHLRARSRRAARDRLHARDALRVELPRRSCGRRRRRPTAGRRARVAAYSFTLGRRLPFAVVDRASLGRGQRRSPARRSSSSTRPPPTSTPAPAWRSATRRLLIALPGPRRARR